MRVLLMLAACAAVSAQQVLFADKMGVRGMPFRSTGAALATESPQFPGSDLIGVVKSLTSGVSLFIDKPEYRNPTEFEIRAIIAPLGPGSSPDWLVLDVWVLEPGGRSSRLTSQSPLIAMAAINSAQQFAVTVRFGFSARERPIAVAVRYRGEFQVFSLSDPSAP